MISLSKDAKTLEQELTKQFSGTDRINLEKHTVSLTKTIVDLSKHNDYDYTRKG